jgi:hypothetical protein
VQETDDAPTGRVCPHHRVPFQCSAISGPTAVHRLADVHDTPTSPPAPSRATFGVCWTFQLWPFQCSASGALVKVPVPPTAVQLVADTQDTASSTELTAGLGGSCSFQVRPFQCSATVPLTGPELLPSRYRYDPTAVQLVADEQETAFSIVLAVCPELLGAGSDASTVHPA